MNDNTYLFVADYDKIYIKDYEYIDRHQSNKSKYLYGQQPQETLNFAGESFIVNYMPSDEMTNNWAGFADKNIRRKFVQKVYSILSLQLLITFGFTALVIFTPFIRSWFEAHAWTYFIAYLIFLSIYIILFCCRCSRHNYPTNFILLTIFTLALSFMVAMICTFHKLDSVLIAAGMTFVCCAAVSLLSFWTKFDFTRIGGALSIAALGLCIACICMLFMRSQILYIIYAAVGTVIFMLFLAYDTQLITGGKKYEISPEEYIMGSIMLYVDIVYIFLFILRLLSYLSEFIK